MTVKEIRFSVDIPEDLHSDFKSQCAQNKKKMGKVIIELILDWLDLEGHR